MDIIDRDKRSENMRKIKNKDTKPEIFVRKMIHNMGYRYRLHQKCLPGKPDLVFSGRHKVIFINGCFWHGHDAIECPDRRRPKSNTAYWNSKLDRNKRRDKENIDELTGSGWKVLVVWDCEIRYPTILKDIIKSFLGPQGRDPKV